MKLKSGMPMTERNVAMLANQIYAAFYALPYDERRAVASAVYAKLDSMSHAMSTAQMHKFMDFGYAVRHNYI